MKQVAMLVVFSILLLAAPTESASRVHHISTPLQAPLSTPEQAGMLDLLVKEAFQRVGHQAEIIYTPTDRSLIAVNEGVYDGEINRIEGMEQSFPNLARVPESNMEMHFVAFAKRDLAISDWKSLAPYKVGFVQGWKIIERNTAGLPNVTHVVKEEQLFRMLEAGRIDIAIYSRLGGYEKLKVMGIEDIVVLEPPLATREMFLYLHKSHKALLLPLAKALREMKRDGTYDSIVKKTCDHALK